MLGNGAGRARVLSIASGRIWLAFGYGDGQSGMSDGLPVPYLAGPADIALRSALVFSYADCLHIVVREERTACDVRRRFRGGPLLSVSMATGRSGLRDLHAR